jgi:pimeloyl-ACP methyl ester carboxylesterase
MAPGGEDGAPARRETGVFAMAVRFFRSKARQSEDSQDALQISGAIIAPSDGPSPVALVDAGHAPHGLGVVRDQYERKIRKNPTIRMVPSSIMVDGRRLRFAVSDNVGASGPDGPGTPPIWAVNIHGYFAGGGMYWRESARLAEQLGWRVINPSLPGFGGSDPLDWQDVSMENLASQVMAIVHKVDAGPVVLLGHSMGGAVAVQFAHDHPRRTLGLIYRDGVSTPAWKDRTGIIPTVLSPLLPDVAPMVDLMAAVLFDLPDLAIGRLYSTVRAVLPDVRQNIRTVAQTMPVGSMLMSLDQRSQVRALVAQQIPILNEWGCFDRITPGHTALEFAAIARSPVLWVPGGHSWMLARPQGQSDILTHLVRGREFQAQVESRWRQLTPREVTLRAVN